jgi:hypothetical protein
MKKSRRPPMADPERLTTDELLAAHERVFGPLDAQAKVRIQRAADSARLAA